MITPYLKMIVTGSEVKPGLHKILGCQEHKGSFWVLGNLEEGGAGPQALRKGAGRRARERGRSGLAGGTALRAETHLVPRAVRGGSEKFGLGLCGPGELAHPCASRDSVPWTTWTGV